MARDDRRERLAAALRANLKRRKGVPSPQVDGETLTTIGPSERLIERD